MLGPFVGFACCGATRRSGVSPSNPAISGSPVGKGRWKTVPGGLMVIEVTSGRMFRGRYAAVTDVSSGASPLLPVSTARHCRYRARGLVMGLPSCVGYGAVQSLQVSSGVRVLPDRVEISTRVP